MWECKYEPYTKEPNIPNKECNVEKCPMQHWVENHIDGCEWELFIDYACKDCPLKKLKEEIINDIQRITGGYDCRNEGKK